MCRVNKAESTIQTAKIQQNQDREVVGLESLALLDADLFEPHYLMAKEPEELRRKMTIWMGVKVFPCSAAVAQVEKKTYRVYI